MPNRESAFGYKNVSGANIQEFTKTGYWKKPNNATFVQVELWGGGGGGGSGGGCGSTGSGGGGGGAYNYRLFNASCLCGTVLVTIGAGGAGGATRIDNGTGFVGDCGGYTGFGAIAGTQSALMNAFGGGGGGLGGTSFACVSTGQGGGVMSVGVYTLSAGFPYSTQLQTAPFNACRAVSSAFGGAAFKGSSVSCRLVFGIGQFGGAAGGTATNSTTYPPHGRAAVLGGTGGGAGAGPTNACIKSGGYGGSRLYVSTYANQLGAKGGINTCANANGKPGCNGCVVSTTYKQITLGYGGGGGAFGKVNATGSCCAPIYYTYSGGRGGNGAIGGGGGGGGGNMGNQSNSPCYPLYGISTTGAGGTGGGGFARIYTW